MSTLLVLSDTHGDVDALTAVFGWAKKHDKADALFFLGDGAADLPLAAARSGFTAPVIVVRGNGDFEPGLQSAVTADFAGKRFLLCHGHLHGVADDLEPLCAAAVSAGADAALYGHTHVPFYEEYRMGGGSLLVLNPGSLGRPRTRTGPTFATIGCPRGGDTGEWFTVRFWNYVKGFPAARIREIHL